MLLKPRRRRQLISAGGDPLKQFIAAVGSARLLAFYHASKNLVAAGGNLISWDDVRGPVGFGPTLLPNGGAGGTAPTVGGGTVNTDGAGSWIAPAGPFIPWKGLPYCVAWWGEMATPGVASGLLTDLITAATFIVLPEPAGGGLINLAYTTGGAFPTSPKVQPGAGVRSLWIAQSNIVYPWDSTLNYEWEWVGRGAAVTPKNGGGGAGPGPAVALLALGRINAFYNALKVRGCAVWFEDVMRATDRAALEAMIVAMADNVNFYGAADSTGAIYCLGDSLTYGQTASVISTTTPVNPAGTTYPCKVQSLLNTNLKAVDVCQTGQPGQLINQLANVQAGQNTSFLGQMAGFGSPQRRAAGKADVMVLWCGVNDLANNRTAVQTIADLTTGVQTLKASGAKVVLATIIPCTGFYTTIKETYRLAVNNAIRAGLGQDLTLDFSLIADPGNAGYLCFQNPSGGADNITDNATYYSDGVHLTDLAYGLVGTTVYNGLVNAGFV